MYVTPYTKEKKDEEREKIESESVSVRWCASAAANSAFESDIVEKKQYKRRLIYCGGGQPGYSSCSELQESANETTNKAYYTKRKGKHFELPCNDCAQCFTYEKNKNINFFKKSIFVLHL